MGEGERNKRSTPVPDQAYLVLDPDCALYRESRGRLDMSAGGPVWIRVGHSETRELRIEAMQKQAVCVCPANEAGPALRAMGSQSIAQVVFVSQGIVGGLKTGFHSDPNDGREDWCEVCVGSLNGSPTQTFVITSNLRNTRETWDKLFAGEITLRRASSPNAFHAANCLGMFQRHYEDLACRTHENPKTSSTQSRVPVPTHSRSPNGNGRNYSHLTKAQRLLWKERRLAKRAKRSSDGTAKPSNRPASKNSGRGQRSRLRHRH